MPLLERPTIRAAHRWVRILFCVPVMLASAVGLSATLPGQVSRIVDGDRIVVTSQGSDYRIRLGGMDAPELNQPWGVAAAQALRRRLAGRFVVVDWSGTDRSQYRIGVVRLNGEDQNLYMLYQGLAWYDPHYGIPQDEEGRRRYAAAENEAREAGLGLWSDRDPIPPWDWRRMR
jgi:endonuclease YncB( thermonuclease family)